MRVPTKRIASTGQKAMAPLVFSIVRDDVPLPTHQLFHRNAGPNHREDGDGLPKVKLIKQCVVTEIRGMYCWSIGCSMAKTDEVTATMPVRAEIIMIQQATLKHTNGLVLLGVLNICLRELRSQRCTASSLRGCTCKPFCPTVVEHHDRVLMQRAHAEAVKLASFNSVAEVCVRQLHQCEACACHAEAVKLASFNLVAVKSVFISSIKVKPAPVMRRL